MNGKSLVMLLLAVASGLGAMYGTSRLITKQKTQATVDLQDVLVAARDLKVEEVLRPDMVKVVQRPKTDIPAGAFTSFKDVEDRWVQISTLEGEPILDRKLALKGTPAGLVARIPKGMRAYAVDVTEQSGVSGFILPDHHVDVVQVDTKESTMDRNVKRTEAETILQDVLVLATGQIFSRPDDRSVISRTVTLAVLPEQVNALVAARAKGPLALSLRGLDDRTQVEVKKPKEVESLALKSDPPAPPSPPPPPPPASTETPPPAEPVVAEPPPARYVTIYKGLERDRRVMVNGSNEVVNSEPDPSSFQ